MISLEYKLELPKILEEEEKLFELNFSKNKYLSCLFCHYFNARVLSDVVRERECVWVVGVSHPWVLRSCCGPVEGCRTWHCRTRCSAPALPPGRWTWWGDERRVEDSASLTRSTSQTEAPSHPDPDGPDALQSKEELVSTSEREMRLRLYPSDLRTTKENSFFFFKSQ